MQSKVMLKIMKELNALFSITKGVTSTVTLHLI